MRMKLFFFAKRSQWKMQHFLINFMEYNEIETSVYENVMIDIVVKSHTWESKNDVLLYLLKSITCSKMSSFHNNLKGGKISKMIYWLWSDVACSALEQSYKICWRVHTKNMTKIFANLSQHRILLSPSHFLWFLVVPLW